MPTPLTPKRPSPELGKPAAGGNGPTAGSAAAPAPALDQTPPPGSTLTGIFRAPLGPAATAAAAAARPTLGPAPKVTEGAHFLQRIKLFSGLSFDDCQQIVKRMRRRDFPPNTTIVREGAPGSSMFFLTSGQVEIRKKDPHTNIDFLLSEMGPGQNFGEMSLLTGKPRTATVTCTQPTTCAVLEQKDFQELLLQYPKKPR